MCRRLPTSIPSIVLWGRVERARNRSSGDAPCPLTTTFLVWKTALRPEVTQQSLAMTRACPGASRVRSVVFAGSPAGGLGRSYHAACGGVAGCSTSRRSALPPPLLWGEPPSLPSFPLGKWPLDLRILTRLPESGRSSRVRGGVWDVVGNPPLQGLKNPFTTHAGLGPRPLQHSFPRLSSLETGS